MPSYLPQAASGYYDDSVPVLASPALTRFPPIPAAPPSVVGDLKDLKSQGRQNAPPPEVATVHDFGVVTEVCGSVSDVLPLLFAHLSSACFFPGVVGRESCGVRSDVHGTGRISWTSGQFECKSSIPCFIRWDFRVSGLRSGLRTQCAYRATFHLARHRHSNHNQIPSLIIRYCWLRLSTVTVGLQVFQVSRFLFFHVRTSFREKKHMRRTLTVTRI